MAKKENTTSNNKMKIPFKPIRLEDANIFSIEGIRRKYWKDFYDNCHNRLEFISSNDTYEDKYKNYKSFHLLNCASNKNFPIIPLEWDIFMPLKVNDQSLVKFQNAYNFFLDLQTEDKAVLPMLMVLLKMQESIEQNLNADAEMLEYLYPRECVCTSENHNKYKVVLDETKPNDNRLSCDISLSEKEIIEWLFKERTMDEDWSYYLNHASFEEGVYENSKKTAVTIGSLAIDLISCIIESYNQSLTKFEENYFEKITLKRCEFKKALLYRLYKTYLISTPEVISIFEENPNNLVKQKLLETRMTLIDDIKGIQLGKKWCECIGYDDGLEIIGKFLINHRDEISEEEEKSFFYLLDEISLITDILIGNVKNNWPNAEYDDEICPSTKGKNHRKQDGRSNHFELPAELMTDEAEILWQRLRDARFIVADGYALAKGVSNNQATYIAYRFREKLRLRHKWKPFIQLWGIQNMAQFAGNWQRTGNYPPRTKEIDVIFGVKPDKPKGYVKLR